MNIKKVFMIALLFAHGAQAADAADSGDCGARIKLFRDAVKKGRAGVPIVRKLLDSGFHVDTPMVNPNRRNALTFTTPVLESIWQKNIGVLALLIERKADVNQGEFFQDRADMLGTPLSNSLWKDRLVMAGMLLKAGARYDSGDYCALMEAEKQSERFKNVLARYAPLTEEQRTEELIRRQVFMESHDFKRRLGNAFNSVADFS